MTERLGEKGVTYSGDPFASHTFMKLVVKGEIRDGHEPRGEKQSKLERGKKATADSVGSGELGGV